MTIEIYLDSNATNAVLPAAAQAAQHAMTQGFGNPSSTHVAGLRAKALLDSVRQRAARVLGAGRGRLIFNSGATEGIHTAVLSALLSVRERRAAGAAVGRLLLCGATEHKAVPESLAHWNRLLDLGLEIVALPVDREGRHDLARLRALAPEAALLCTMAANNETGVVSDLTGIEHVLTASGSSALWLVDGVQALGKLALNLAATRIDYAPFSGHKLCAPKGIGLLYVRDAAPFTPLMVGGGQEAGARSGTENMAGIAALGAVLQALEEGHTFASHATLAGFRDRLADSLRDAFAAVRFNTPFEKALPTTLNFSVAGLASQELLNLFDAAGVRVSAGSACSSGGGAPSHVLEAMQLPAWCCGAAVRLSFGPQIDAAGIDAACGAIARCGAALRHSGRPPAAAPARAHDGVMAWDGPGHCGWLITDAARRRCVVIDPPAALHDRMVAHIASHELAVLAVLGTSQEPQAVAARAALGAALGPRFAPPAAADEFGWPGAAGLPLGDRLLVRIDAAAGQVVYRLGRPTAGALDAAATEHAFSGLLAPALLPAGSIHLDTLLCQGRPGVDLPSTSLRAERQASLNGDHQLADLGALHDLLRRHPGARLIDVREAHEHAAAPLSALTERGAPAAALNVPISQLAAHAQAWLQADDRPALVFLCRSGPRSGQAAAWMRRLGHPQAWHLAGGLAAVGHTGPATPSA